MSRVHVSEGREMEIALAPFAGTRLLAPFRVSVVSMLANLVIEANRFERLRNHWALQRLLIRRRSAADGCLSSGVLTKPDEVLQAYRH
jgi:hypothetical protein